MAKTAAQPTEKAVDPQHIAHSLAKAVYDGDIVNFRLIFAPFSPARTTSTERYDTAKYAYLLPDEDLKQDPEFLRMVDRVQEPETWKHIENELQAKRPAQLPSSLLVPLADHAVRHGKFSSAAQAYELLRMRRRMLGLFMAEGERALDDGDYAKAARALRIASGLAYDYAAFPEPLPLIPNYQTEALKLHGVYPTRPEDCPAWLDAESHSELAIEFLLVDAEVAGCATKRPHQARIAFLQELVRQIDPNWDAFVDRYREATQQTQDLRDYLERRGLGTGRSQETLEDEVEGQQFDDPSRISATLLGYHIEDGEWWQYMKELAYRHPAAVLFVARQLVGDQEILIPPLRTKPGLATMLGLLQLEHKS